MIRLGAIGDVIRTLPAVSALRAGYPRARISWLVEPPSRSGVEAQPWVDEVIVFPRPALREALGRGRLGRAARLFRAFLGELRSRRFELAVDFHAILKSGLLARASGARLCVSYAAPYGRELAWLFAHRRAALSESRASRFDRNLALVRFLGVSEEPSDRPYQVSPHLREEVGAGLGGRSRPVVLHPGTSPATPHKRWPPDRYAALARLLWRGHEIPALVTAGPAPGERETAQAIVDESGGGARVAPATPSLAHLAALLQASRLYIGGDTGPMHVASLVGTPVVQLLGPTDPLENAPYPGTPSVTVREQVACNPCRRGCAAATCMRVLEPETVLRAALALLAAGKARADGA